MTQAKNHKKYYVQRENKKFMYGYEMRKYYNNMHAEGKWKIFSSSAKHMYYIWDVQKLFVTFEPFIIYWFLCFLKTYIDS